MKHEEFEKLVMNMILDGKDELLNSLREQYLQSQIISREFTGCGFFTTFSSPDTIGYDSVKGRIDDLNAKISNTNDEYLFFILYLEEGKIDTLECFTTVASWNGEYDNVVIEYCYKGERRFEVNGEEITVKI